MQRKDWTNAEKQLLKELENNPQNAEAWFLLGYVRGEQRNFKGMVEAFEKSLELTDKFAKDISQYRLKYWIENFNRGVRYFQRSRDSAHYIDKAIEAFQTAILIIPDSASAYKNLAYLYLAKGNIEGAIEPLKKAVELSESLKDTIDLDALIMLGKVYYDLGSRHLNRFDTYENRREIRAEMTKDEVKSSLGEPDEVITPKPEPKKRRRRRPPEPKVEKWLYKRYGLTLKFENDVLKSWELRGQKFENGFTVFYADSTEFYAAREWYDKAIDIFEKARNINPADEEILSILSNAYINSGRSNEALEMFKASVEQHPENKYFRYNLGVLLLKREQFEDAIKHFKGALEIDPNYESALYNLAASYVNWGVKLKEEGEKVLFRKDIDEKTRLEENKKYEEMANEKFKEALKYLEQLVEMKPDDPTLWELLGKIYANLGMVEKAENAFKRADEIRGR
jgi:tetratricopeptide (TPR) repeat protein